MHFHSVNYCVMNDVMCIRSTYRYVHKKQTMHPSTQTTLITLVALLLHSSRLTSAFTSISSNRQSSFIFERSISSSSGSKRNVISSESSALAEILAADSSEDVESLLRLPRHASNEKVNLLLEKCDEFLNEIHKEMDGATGNRCELEIDDLDYNNLECPNDFTSVAGERVFANYYVDMGKVDTVGFDFDYTLVTYTNELLEMIYEMALVRLVNDNSYPSEMMEILKFDGNFSIRGLAVDRENGWICQLCYTHKVAVAWEGREKVSKKKLIEAYRGKRRLVPDERKKRLKPLNDLFSMAECCLMADVVQYFKDQGIPFHATSVVKDVLSAIGSTHISGEFHKIVAENPERYFEPKPYLKDVLEAMKNANKKLIFVSNSPFWYVDAGMKYVVGENWRNDWDVVIVSAGKPIFYTDSSRPFREVSFQTGRVKFKKIDKLEKGEVYTEGCLNELIRCVDWDIRKKGSDEIETFGSNVLYIGDSLFADLVDAKRQYGWTTAVVTPEVGWELEKEKGHGYEAAQRSIDLILHILRQVQVVLGNNVRSDDDSLLLDHLEAMVSKWRDRQQQLLGNPFGSIFRARHQPSLFAHSIRRYCDLYMSSVGNIRHYSPQHRFYPEDTRLLSHEAKQTDIECWNIDDLYISTDVSR